MADIYYGEYVKLRMKARKAADNNRFQVNNSLWTLNNGPKWFLHGFDRDKPDLLLSPNVNENKGMQSNSYFLSYYDIDKVAFNNNTLSIASQAFIYGNSKLYQDRTCLLGNKDYINQPYKYAHNSFLFFMPNTATHFNIDFDFYCDTYVQQDHWLDRVSVYDNPDEAVFNMIPDITFTIEFSHRHVHVHVEGDMSTTGLLAVSIFTRYIDAYTRFSCSSQFTTESGTNVGLSDPSTLFYFSNTMNYTLPFQDLNACNITPTTNRYNPVFYLNSITGTKDGITESPEAINYFDLVKIKPFDVQLATLTSNSEVHYSSQYDHPIALPFFYDRVYKEIWMKSSLTSRYLLSTTGSKGLIKLKAIEDATIFNYGDVFITRGTLYSYWGMNPQTMYLPAKSFTAVQPTAENTLFISDKHIIPKDIPAEIYFYAFKLDKAFFTKLATEESYKYTLVKITGVYNV